MPLVDRGEKKAKEMRRGYRVDYKLPSSQLDKDISVCFEGREWSEVDSDEPGVEWEKVDDE